MEYLPLLNGKDLKTDRAEEIRNPFSGETVSMVFQAGEGEMDAAIEGAAKAFKDYSRMPSYVKSEILYRISAMISERREELARLITAESGKPIMFARAECDRAAVTFRLGAEEVARFGGEMLPLDIAKGSEGYLAVTRRFPVGVVGAISPFNFPLNLAAHKVSPALAAGNCVVLKPPPQSPSAGICLGKIALEAGLPPGVFNVIPCPVPVAEMLVRDDRVKLLSFTGSPAVGWHIKSIAGKKRVVLELGGNAAVIVEPDANISFAAPRIAVGAFANAGQICISVQRIYVHEQIYDLFMERFLEETSKLKSGDPFDDDTVVGPMISAKEADRAFSWIEEAREGGAKILLGGERDGNVIKPTVITGYDKDMKVCRLEVFAPVTVVERYSSFESALDKVNDSIFGLQAGVFTRDINKALSAFRSLEVGGVVINDYPTFRVDNYPYGGVKDSGLGREGVKYAMEEMSEVKTLIIRSL